MAQPGTRSNFASRRSGGAACSSGGTRRALVRRPRADLPDWRDRPAYEPLLQSERAAFAWEWLRRQPDYRKAARAALGEGGKAWCDAARWNLHAFEDPALAVPAARPVWRASAHPWVVDVRASPASAGGDALDLERLGPFASLVDGRGTQHLLLSDGYRSIRLDVAGAGLGASPVRLSFQLSGIAGLKRPMLVIERLRSLAMTGRFARSLHPPARRARRLVLALRAFDALSAGATQAEIASVLISPKLERRRWRVHSPSLRSQAQRLVAGARRMAGGEFWRLLE